MQPCFYLSWLNDWLVWSEEVAGQPYWDHGDGLVAEAPLIFSGHRLVIPACMRAELMAVTHASHVGIQAHRG